MSWGMAAQVGLSLVQGSIASKQAAEQSAAVNKATQAYNQKVLYSSLEQVNQLNMQRAQQRQASAGALFNVRQQGMSARDQITTQAAATDTIGASVNDAVATVNQQQDQAEGTVYDQYKQAVQQSNLMLNKITDSGINSLRDPTADTSKQVMDNAIVGAAGQVAGYYIGKAASSITPSTTDTRASVSAAGSGGYDIHGYSLDSAVSKNPFGLSYGFQSSNLLK